MTKKLLNKQLLEATKQGDKKLVALSLAEGADPNIADEKEGNRPLHFALMNKHIEIAALLFAAKADEHLRNNNDKSPVDLADSKTAEWFIQHSRKARLAQLFAVENKASGLAGDVAAIKQQLVTQEKLIVSMNQTLTKLVAGSSPNFTVKPNIVATPATNDVEKPYRLQAKL